jgi:hypothetical protein
LRLRPLPRLFLEFFCKNLFKKCKVFGLGLG